MARILLAIGPIVMLWHSGECVNHKNDFDAISGCLQYDNVPGYHDPQLYFPTSRFRNMVRTPHSRILRMGIVGVKDANFRYGRSAFPATGEQVVEIVLGGWDNTKSAGRFQVRRWNIENTLLKDAETPRIMSGSRPLVFKMEVFDNGLVELTKDGENRPFFAFTNPQKTITVDYIAFTKWEMDMIYFYDCPL
ncbi:AGAP006193-PA-like protein [Anopheles sinensis]|uniref:AGAP006193-PA-like protein n=1 Tax=Anopheles sinensis TaxID=74873 RepID=A0A084WL81_ANOSI|nr:AGAP006193-PA-like protein [Anopheles sinensis]